MGLLSKISKVNLRTIYFNFKLLPFAQAYKLPILLSRKVQLFNTSGSCKIEGKVTSGMIKIGFGQIGMFDRRYSRSVLEIKGNLIFKGQAKLGPGSKLNIGENAELTIGDNLMITAESGIACHKNISIGNDCLISWETQIMDTDFHKIYDQNDQQINKDSSIIIGDNVWIGSRCTITKGSIITSNIVIASNSLINKEYDEENTLIGGQPARILKKDIYWEE